MRRFMLGGLVTAWLVATTACSDSAPAIGTLGAPCPNDNNCERPLVCRQNVCSNPPPDAGQPPVIVDAGPPDAVVDAGPDGGVVDAGEPDGGEVCDIPPTLLAIRDEIFGASDGDPHCNQVFCHGPQPAADVRLTLPLPQLHEVLLGPTRDETAAERNLVVPGDPDASRLWVIMVEANPGGRGGPMPPEAPVDPCALDAVRQWIEDGAPRN